VIVRTDYRGTSEADAWVEFSRMRKANEHVRIVRIDYRMIDEHIRR